MNKSLIKLLLSTIVICYFCGTAFAQDELKKNRRLEAKYSFETLTPNNIYGNRHSLDTAFYHTVEPGFTYNLGLSTFERNEGVAALANIGVTKEWHRQFYTYTALSAGTNSEYLPRFRADNDFNIKFGNQIVWTTGIAYIKYFDPLPVQGTPWIIPDVPETLILSTGFTLYLDEVILTYRLFHNNSDPGSVTSYSHLANIGYGREGWQWTYFEGSYGNQAYLATNLTKPQEVDQDATSFNIKHRRWIKNGFGIILEAGYFKLEDGYEKYLMSPGVFKEF